MTTLYIALLVAGALVTLGLIAGLYSQRIGVSHLLVFLVVGMLAGVDGPLGMPFDDVRLAVAFGNLALATILLDGGLRTPFANLRAGGAGASLLATVGVAVTAAVTGAIACAVLGIDRRHGLLLGTVLASTDAAAVFAQLAVSGTALPRRVMATIEVESGLNDPMAMCLMLAMVSVIQHPDAGLAGLLPMLARQLGLGLGIGLASGWLLCRLLARLPITDDHDGLVALLLSAVGLSVFAAVSLVDGSGFLAVYVLGLVVARQRRAVVRPALPALNGFTWVAQAGLFLLLGLLVTPHQLPHLLWPALAVAAGLVLVARPLAVALCLTPLRFGWREQVFVSWVGLRGAVPIVLAGTPVMAGLTGAGSFFNIAFIVVLASLLLQGPTMGLLARWLGLDLTATPAGAPDGLSAGPPTAADAPTAAAPPAWPAVAVHQPGP
jgi:cell volume regulation protein A